jgi:excisionase family DNA binding protein
MARIPGYLTVKEAAEIRKVWPQAILNLIDRKRLPAVRVGREWLIKETDLEAFEPLPVGRPPKKKRLRKSPKAPGARRSQK